MDIPTRASVFENDATLCSITGVVVEPGELIVVFDNLSELRVLKATESIEVVGGGVAWPILNLSHVPPSVVFQIDDANKWTPNYLQRMASVKWFSIRCSSTSMVDNILCALAPDVHCIRCTNMLRSSQKEHEHSAISKILVLVVIHDVSEFTCTVPFKSSSTLVHCGHYPNAAQFVSNESSQSAYPYHRCNLLCLLRSVSQSASYMDINSQTLPCKHVSLENIKQEDKEAITESDVCIKQEDKESITESDVCETSKCNLHSEIEFGGTIKEEAPEVSAEGDLVSICSETESLPVRHEIDNDCCPPNDTLGSVGNECSGVSESDVNALKKGKHMIVKSVRAELGKCRPFMLHCPECDKTVKGGVMRLPSLYKHVRNSHAQFSDEVNRFLKQKYSRMMRRNP